MGFFSKRLDPIAERERAIEAELTQLRAQIARAESGAPPAPAHPRLRPATRPDWPKAAPAPVAEAVHRVKTSPGPEAMSAHFNELGVRKFDLISAVRRIMNNIRGGPVPQAKVVTLLAAGGIHGLRPLRYERRVARNRFLALFIGLLLGLFGLFVMFMKNR